MPTPRDIFISSRDSVRCRLILVGGKGTRLRPLTLTLPKPAIPLVDRPFMRYMVDWLGSHGSTRSCSPAVSFPTSSETRSATRCPAAPRSLI